MREYLHSDPELNCNILTLNGGSSSIKYAVFRPAEFPDPYATGALTGLGSKKAVFKGTVRSTGKVDTWEIAENQASPSTLIVDWLKKNAIEVDAIGHRIVHGMQHTKPEPVTDELLNALREIGAYDPTHLSAEVKLIEAFLTHYPGVPQVACFDTAFHANMPTVAKLIALPRRFYEMGIYRYGFHGLSCHYLVEELERIAGNAAAKGRTIIAHLGHGASLTAVKDGQSIDTSMGFTPASGIPMSSRSGDLDPGVVAYLFQHEEISAAQFNDMINREAGLLGISGTSADMRELLEREAIDTRAAEAVDLFCYQAKKCVGSLAAVLGGLDNLVFSGGIGEHAAAIRARICQGLDFLGITLDPLKNEKNEEVISTLKGKVTVWVLATNEELMMAKLVSQVLTYSTP